MFTVVSAVKQVSSFYCILIAKIAYIFWTVNRAQITDYIGSPVTGIIAGIFSTIRDNNFFKEK